MANSISRKTWEDAKDHDTKLNILFDLTWQTNEEIKCLKKRKRIDSALAMGTGFVGGAGAVLAKIAFWK